jgi:Kef-type K+ transport system membrane component KefB
VSKLLVRLQDTTAQIRVRGAMFLLMLLILAAQEYGLAAILGAFVAGAIVSVADRDGVRTHPLFRVKLDAIGYGFLIPVFMVAAGLSFDLQALLDEPSVLVRVPVFVVALLVVRGVPALVYRPLLGVRGSMAAGLLQATSLPFIVAATEIGQSLGIITRATAAAFVTAGLVSALVFPWVASGLLRGEPGTGADLRRGVAAADPGTR